MSEPAARPDRAVAPAVNGHWVKLAPPLHTAWLPNGLLVASALWGVLATAMIWLGSDPPLDQGASREGLAALAAELVRSSRNAAGMAGLALAALLMDEAYCVARFRGRRLPFNRYWVVIGWILPVGNFWLPKIFVDDLLAANAAPDADARRRKRATALWWPLWLIVFTGALTLYTLPTTNPEVRDTTFWLRVLVTLAVVPAYLTWWRVVRELSSATRIPARTEPPAR